MKTTRDQLNCIQRDDESLSEFLEIFIQTKAQVPNASEETVIAAAVEVLVISQCTSHFARNYPTSVRELFEVMRQYERSDDDLKKQKATQNSWRQADKAPRPPLAPSQQNMRPFRAINNLQEQPEHSPAKQGL